nr:hypothetical protein [uncultured Flavobacterium sp.]
MKKNFIFLILLSIFSNAYSLESATKKSNTIIDTWVWEKSIGSANNPYVSTPKSIGYNKKITFTSDGRVITYKNNVEIRNSTYELKKGISAIDSLEHDLISFEGTTYVIENIDNDHLTIVINATDGAKSIYKR